MITNNLDHVRDLVKTGVISPDQALEKLHEIWIGQSKAQRMHELTIARSALDFARVLIEERMKTVNPGVSL